MVINNIDPEKSKHKKIKKNRNSNVFFFLPRKNNQGNQDSGGNRKNAMQGQIPDMKIDTHNKEHKSTKLICTEKQKQMSYLDST